MTDVLSSTISRRALLTGIGIAGAGWALAGCSSSQPGPGASAMQSAAGRTLRVAGGEFGYPSPFAMPHSGYTTMSLLFDTLVWADDGGLQPWLAESFESSEDLTSVTIRLRDGVTWSDGKPLTIDDVASPRSTSRSTRWHGRWTPTRSRTSSSAGRGRPRSSPNRTRISPATCCRRCRSSPSTYGSR